ncbi:Inter-alpha-trypsin inhibitor heavy chain H4 [Myotis davidii]|uniref:Inter-alpha-trypsin inhibitor heavy chain H4 n=1 Tax=Myotis davidii TaxID=225400 RepID=L5MEH9_MYODS|nr:Inter-alpha-trypsin inhibitor heavy chain H4 [Myotis davidii]
MSIGPPGFPVPSNYLFPFSKSDLDPRLPSETDVLPASRTASAAPAPIQASTFILPLPGQSGDQLCVDIKSTRGPLLLLLSDPDQGEALSSHVPEKPSAVSAQIELEAKAQKRRPGLFEGHMRLHRVTQE